MVFISFGANALTIEELYKDCKPYQNSGLKFKKLSSGEVQRAILCFSYLGGLRDRGRINCVTLNELNKMKFVDKYKLEVISSLTANARVSNNQIITSFINYAENNTEYWKQKTSAYVNKFLSKKFPCKFEK